MVTPPMINLRFGAKRCTSIPMPTRFIRSWNIASLPLAKQRFRDGQIGRRRDLEVEEWRLNQMHWPAEQFDRRSLVGDHDVLLQHQTVGFPEQFALYGLWRLHRPQSRAVHGALDGAIGRRFLDGIDDLRRGDAGPVSVRAGDGSL